MKNKKQKVLAFALFTVGMIFIGKGLLDTYNHNKITNNEKTFFSNKPIADIEKDGFKINENYIRIETNTKNNDKKLHIKEYFSYSCPHCYKMEEKVKEMLEKYPNIIIDREHPGFNESWRNDARIFYSLKELNIEEKYHDKIMSYSHEKLFDKNLLSVIDNEDDLKNVKKIINNQDKKIDKINYEMSSRHIMGVPTFVFNDEVIFSMNSANKNLFFDFVDSIYKYYTKK